MRSLEAIEFRKAKIVSARVARWELGNKPSLRNRNPSFAWTGRSGRNSRALVFLLLFLILAATASAQRTAFPQGLDPKHATALAERMCRQLPNVETILGMKTVVPDSAALPAPTEEMYVTDDVYDALLRLGPYSLPCLTERLLDTRWMPDPREEPLLGVPHVGDVAYIILMDKGVADVLRALAHKKADAIRMDEYFLWPSVGDHRKRLQNAVRAWLVKHPDCCGAPPVMWPTSPAQVKFQMSAAELATARTEFLRLRPGMSPAQVQKIVGKPDAIDLGGETPDHFQINLLGLCANDHNEHLAYIYFTERWTDEIGRRDPLHDRYLIIFFSAEGKFTRMFSNVPEIPAIFPSGARLWQRLMWGKSATDN
jgi:hypothetical protein